MKTEYSGCFNFGPVMPSLHRTEHPNVLKKHLRCLKKLVNKHTRSGSRKNELKFYLKIKCFKVGKAHCVLSKYSYEILDYVAYCTYYYVVLCIMSNYGLCLIIIFLPTIMFHQ